MAKRLMAPVVASLYDKSKGLSILSEADKDMMISSKKASRVEDETIEDEEDDYKQTYGVEDSLKKNIELDKYDYQMQPLTFPASKSDGVALCLERLDYMTKQVGRLRRGQCASPKNQFGRMSLSRMDVHVNEAESLQDNTLKASEESMEKALFECCQPRRSDYRLLELLGSQGQNVLQQGQLKIVEYFRYKSAMMDPKAGFGSSFKDAVVPNDDDQTSSPSDMPKLPEVDMANIREDPLKGLVAQFPEGLHGLEELSLDGCIARRGSMMESQVQGNGRRRLPPALDQVEESPTHHGSQLSTPSMQKTRASGLQSYQGTSSQNLGERPTSSSDQEAPKAGKKGGALLKPGKKEERAPSKGRGSKMAKKRDAELPPLPIKKKGTTQRS